MNIQISDDENEDNDNEMLDIRDQRQRPEY
jgi:hypothetical protein